MRKKGKLQDKILIYPMRFLIILLLLFQSASAQTGSAGKTGAAGNSLLWEVSGNGLTSPSYLFGTFHLLCKEDVQFSKALKDALERSALVYMELDMDDPSVMLGGLTLMNMKNGRKLKDLFKEDEYKRIEAYFRDSLKTPLTMFQGMKPMMLLSLIYPRLMSCNTMSGVEMQLMNLAQHGKKEIRGLETMAFQASMLDSIPYEMQAAELLKTVDSPLQSKRLLDSMIQAYKNQDMVALERMMNDDSYGLDGDQDLLLGKRNSNWVAQLKVIMHKQPVFVAVGTGHLPGPEGVIALLKKEGYTVKPVEN